MVKKGCLVVAGILVVAVIAALVYADVRYHAIRPAERIPQAAFASSFAVVRLQLLPDHAGPVLEERLSGLMPGASSALPWVMPYEIGLLCDPDVNARVNSLTLYANTRRLGPAIAEMLNAGGRFRNDVTRILGGEWDAAGVQTLDRGEALIRGSAPIRPEIVDLTREQWGVVSPLTPIESTAEHLFELVLDLRDGRAFTVVAGLVPPQTPPSEIIHPSQLIHLLKNTATFRLTGDPIGVEALSLHLEVECRPELSESDANSTSFLLNTVTAQLGETLNEAYGVTLEGRCDPEGMRVIGDYTLRGVDRLLDEWLPAPGAPPAS